MRIVSIIMVIFLGAILSLPAMAQRELTQEDWQAIREGEIVRESNPEGGTQNRGWAVGVFDVPIDVMWQALISLELYDEFTERTTVSVLLDPKTKEKVVKQNPWDADDAEKLFKGNTPGFVLTDPDNPDRFTIYSYQRNSFPWPISDRWVLLEMQHDNSTHTQTWRRIAGNMKEDYGSWVLEPYRENQTLGHMQIHVDLAIPATGPFTNFAMNLTLPDTFESFEAIGKHLMQNKTGKENTDKPASDKGDK